LKSLPTASDGQAAGNVRPQLPTLAQLGLSDHELQLLTQQGYMRTENRSGKIVHRLRFRDGDRQRAIYVSKQDVDAVSAELAFLQEGRKSRQNLKRIGRLANKKLREHVALLTPLMESCDYRRHGHQFRRRRIRTDNYTLRKETKQ